MDSKVTKRVLVVGASGYIGQAVVRQLLQEGYFVYAVLRQSSKLDLPHNDNLCALTLDMEKKHLWTDQLPEVDVVISCLASRSGSASEANYVDYGLNCDLLNFACKSKIEHFVLLSAICVQRPKLAFQRAKLKFHSKLISSGLRFSIVLPTAYFKSLSGQINRIKNGKSFLVFGSGEETRSLPISEVDLARYVINCIRYEKYWNKSLPLGGPGPALTPIDQAEMLFEIFGKPKKIKHISPRVFDLAIVFLIPFALFSQKIKDKVELLKIGKYYARESMLVYDAEVGSYDANKTPQFGDSLLYDYYCTLRDDPQSIPNMGSQKLFG